jgi:signal transduction histidine kinase/CheY-like chemotaxis protein
LLGAAVLNRSGKQVWAGRLAAVAMLLSATLLVFEARDGIRSISMLLFPAVLVICVMTADGASYKTTAAIVLATVAGLGIAEMHGLTRAIPHVRSTTVYGSIVNIDLVLLVLALLVSRVARDRHSDVTEMRTIVDELTAANRALKESAERLRANEARLLDTERLAKVGSWELDPETGKLLWSGEMFRIFGMPDTAKPNFDIFMERVHRKDRQKIVESRDTAVRSAGPIKLDFRIVRPDGAVRFVRSIVETLKNDVGEPLRFLGATQDVSEQILANQTLRESEERLKNAERISHLGHWGVDVKTDELLWSDEVFRIFGQPKTFKPTVDAYLESIAPSDRNRVRQWVQDCRAKNLPGPIEYQIVRPNGDQRTITSTGEVVLDDEDSPARLFGTCQDITDARREQEEAFARQKLESVGTLASGIAHDFNNLLGGVLAQVESALTQLETGSAPVDELRTIREVALRGSEIVRQLMIYAGKESEKAGTIDVSQTVAEMLPLLELSISKRARLIPDLGQNLPLLQANAGQIRQIVLNLVTNASQAIGDRDGTIRLSTRRVAALEAAQLGKASVERDYVELEVSDNGCGMSQELQSKVFDLFFTTGSTGHGLGLAVVQGIVRNLGGMIQLHSEIEKGATFRILIPGASTVAEPTPLPPGNDWKPARERLTGTVMVVEDEAPLRLAVVKVLRGLGAEVFEAADGAEALELLRTKGDEIEAILLDLTIPGPSSREVLSAAQRWPKLRVVLTSAFGKEMAAPAMSSSSVHSFIRKPFSLTDIVRTLREVLSA